MSNLKAELAEAEAKHEAVYDDIVSLEANRDKIEVFIKATKAKIADAEVTYSIGDRFTVDGKEEDAKAMLAMNGEGKTYLVSLRNGQWWGFGVIEVADTKRVTKKELHTMCALPMTRYWDNRKQQKVSE